MNRFTDILVAALLAGYMTSAEQVAREYQAATPGAALRNEWKAPAAYLVERKVLTGERFAELELGYRRFAFTIARVESKRLIETARDLLADNVRQGGDRAAWGKTVDKAFARAGVEPLNPWHAETVYRTNIATAYSAANYDMLHHPAMAEEFPALRFETVGDTRVSDICRPLHGVTLPRDHVFWTTHWPPLHHACRSTVRPVHRDDLGRADMTPSNRVPPSAADPGFGRAGGADEQWTVAKEIERA